jgi:hypothetical protein
MIPIPLVSTFCPARQKCLYFYTSKAVMVIRSTLPNFNGNVLKKTIYIIMITYLNTIISFSSNYIYLKLKL